MVPILYVKDSSDVMTESAVEHKDWKKLLEIMRGGAKEQAVKWKIPSEAVRIFGILFGAETCVFLTMTVVQLAAEGGGVGLGYHASLGPLLKLNCNDDLLAFYMTLAKIRCFGLQMKQYIDRSGQTNWVGSVEKLIGMARTLKDSLVVRNSGHLFPKTSIVGNWKRGQKQKRQELQVGRPTGDGDEDHLKDVVVANSD